MLNNLEEIYAGAYVYDLLISDIVRNYNKKHIKENKTITNLELTMLIRLKEGQLSDNEYLELNENNGSLRQPSNSLKKYLNKNIAKKVLPTEDDVVAAVESYKKHPNKKDFDLIIQKYGLMIANLIWKNSSKLTNFKKDISFDEVFNAMVVNVARAINGFKPDKGIKFSTYLFNWLREVILNPNHYSDKFENNLKKLNVIDIKKHGKSNVAMRHVVSGDATQTSRNTKSKTYREFGGFDTLTGDEGDFAKQYQKLKNVKELKKIINSLPKRERDIINIKYGFVDNSKYKNEYGNVTDINIAKDFNITSASVKNIVNKALETIRKKLALKMKQSAGYNY